MTDDDLTPGQKFAKYREDKGWSYRDVGTRAGLNHGTVANFEKRIGGYENMEAGTIPRLARGYGLSEAAFRSILNGADLTQAGFGPESLRTHPDWQIAPVRSPSSAGADEPEYLNGASVYIPRQTLADHNTTIEHVDVYIADASCATSDEARLVKKPVVAFDHFVVDKRHAPNPGEVMAGWWAAEGVIALVRYRVDGEGVLLRSFIDDIPTRRLSNVSDLVVLGRVIWRGG